MVRTMDDWRASRRPLLKPKEQQSQSATPVEREEKTWKQVWSWLKPRLDKAGRTDCEFVGIIDHECKGPLDPVHSKKRRKFQGNDIYAVALGCRTTHNYVEGIKVYPPLNRRINQAEMERYVLEAIAKHGGLILP